MIVTNLDPNFLWDAESDAFTSTVHDMLNGHAARALTNTSVTTNQRMNVSDESRARGSMRVAITFVVDIPFSYDPDQDTTVRIVTEDPEEWVPISEMS